MLGACLCDKGRAGAEKVGAILFVGRQNKDFCSATQKSEKYVLAMLRRGGEVEGVATEDIGGGISVEN